MTLYDNFLVEISEPSLITIHLTSSAGIFESHLQFKINLTEKLFGQFYIIAKLSGIVTLLQNHTRAKVYVTFPLLSKLINELETIPINKNYDHFLYFLNKWRDDITTLEASSDFSLEPSDTKVKPASEVAIYIPTTPSFHEQENIVNACGDFMEALGFEMKTEDEPIYNSFWQKIRFILKRNVTEQDVHNLFDKGKKALELKHVDLPTAEQTEKLANAVDKLMNTVNKFDSCTIRLGSLLIVKRMVNEEPTLKIHQLTLEEIKYIEKNYSLLKEADPLAILADLAPEDTGNLQEQERFK